MEVNKDLVKERKAATFNSEKLTEVIYGGASSVKRRRYLQNIVFQDKYIQSFKPWWNRSRMDEYEVGLKKNVYLNKLIKDLDVTDPREQFYLREATANHEVLQLGLHQTMFVPTIDKQGTPEQVRKYGDLARQYKILGTYAQTELGHGTFVRGLETTATYDAKTEEFVIHSPTLTSMKFWPGALGHTSNFVVMMAQLYAKGQCHGIHSFIVQIRSLEDHTPLPGVRMGDIGNKIGYGGMDNGYLIFDHFRVPRDAMLMRYAKVERDGIYTKPQNTKLTYGSMVFIRSLIASDCARSLAQCCIIATRYSAVRRQTEIRPGSSEELQVIDYQTQQEKLFPAIASAYALMFTGLDMLMTYFRISADIEKGQTDEYQVLHASAAGLKATASWMASHMMDNLRMACGGHGYSHASGIPKIWAHSTPACTYEGENTVMLLQSARYLVKCYTQASKGGQLSGAILYLNHATQPSSQLNSAFDFQHLISAYEHVAARLIKSAATTFEQHLKMGASQEEARNKASVQMVQAAIAHTQAYVVKTFTEVVTNPDLDPGTANVLQTLCRLYAVHGICDKLGDFLQDGYLTGKQAEMVSNKRLALFAEIRPNAIALVDAFDYPDQILQSCLGRYDGNVYEALYEFAKASPLNEKDVMDVYHTTLKPLMRGEAPVAKL